MIRTSELHVEVIPGDLTEQRTDAIVNAAISALVRGGGVCGAIFAKAGPELDAACAQLGGCPTGDARLTPAFGIPIRGIIHAVGPRFGFEGGREIELLSSAWRRSLELADDAGFRSIAFPSISTGIYGFPADQAAKIAGETLAEYAHAREIRPTSLELIRIVVRDEKTRQLYADAIAQAGRESSGS